MKTSGLTIGKYYDFLQIVKLRIDKKEIIYVAQMCKDCNVSASIFTALRELKIITQISPHIYEWNSKIPVTITLVKKVLQTINEKAKVSRDKKNMASAQIPLPKPPKVTEKQSKNFDNDLTNYLSIAEAISTYGKSESTIRSIVKKAGKKKGVLKHEVLKNGAKKIYMSIDYLDSIFNKKINIEHIEKPKSEFGVIRKFLRWLW